MAFGRETSSWRAEESDWMKPTFLVSIFGYLPAVPSSCDRLLFSHLLTGLFIELGGRGAMHRHCREARFCSIWGTPTTTTTMLPGPLFSPTSEVFYSEQARHVTFVTTHACHGAAYLLGRGVKCKL